MAILIGRETNIPLALCIPIVKALAMRKGAKPNLIGVTKEVLRLKDH